MHTRGRLATAIAVVLLLLLGIALAVAQLWIRGVEPRPTTVIGLPSLWVTDDELGVTANITLAGTRIRAFPTPRGASSSIAVDPVDGSLWGVGDQRFRAPRLVNYDATGQVLGQIPVGAFGGFRAEGVAVAPASDGSLWVVDDPDVDGRASTLYRIDRTGALLESTPTAAFWPESASPQDVAHDPYDDTLWITDNAADRVLHVTTGGELVGSFSTEEWPFVTPDRPDGVRNPQAVAVVSPTELLLSTRYTGELLRISKSGTAIVGSLPVTVLDEDALAITGCAVSPTTAISSTREGVLTVHDALLVEGDDAGARLTDVVDGLRELLDSSSAWTDDGEPSRGDLVFGAIATAVQQLGRIEDGAVTPASPARRALVDVARHAADRRVAVTETARPRDAVDAVERGDVARSADDLATAVDSYEEAFDAAGRTIDR